MEMVGVWAKRTAEAETAVSKEVLRDREVLVGVGSGRQWGPNQGW